MRVLFVYGNAYATGGIQTWLMRMLPRIRAAGHEVGLLTRPRGKPWDTSDAVLEALAPDVDIHIRDPRWFKAPGALGAPIPAADVIFACNVEAVLLSALVQRHVMPDARIIAGVFHPREYCLKVPLIQRRYGLHLIERLIRDVPEENFMFSTPGMLSRTEACLGRDLSRGPVLPLSIDTEAFRPPSERRVEPGKVVSVARLVRLYPHHAQMIRVIRELRDGGHVFTYHVHGDGNEQAALEAEARRLGVDDAVVFHGALEYARFPEAVRDAFAFIASGTALLEAAGCGVPALMAVAGHSEPVTHGFVHESEGHELGGYCPGHPHYRISERLLWLAGRSDDEYAEVERASRAKAEEYDVEALVPRLVDILAGARPHTLAVSALDRALGQLDWWYDAALLKLGAPDGWTERYLRNPPVDTSAAAREPVAL